MQPGTRQPNKTPAAVVRNGDHVMSSYPPGLTNLSVQPIRSVDAAFLTALIDDPGQIENTLEDLAACDRPMAPLPLGDLPTLTSNSSPPGAGY